MDDIITQSKFRFFLFRWKIYNLLNKLMNCDKESYEYKKIYIEINEHVKRDFDSRLSI